MPLQPSRGLLRTTKAVLGLGGVTEHMLSEGGDPSQAKAMVTSPPTESRVRVGGRCKGLLTSDPPGIEGECGSLIRRSKFKSPKHWRPKFVSYSYVSCSICHSSDSPVADIRLSLSHLTLE